MKCCSHISSVTRHGKKTPVLRRSIAQLFHIKRSTCGISSRALFFILGKLFFLTLPRYLSFLTLSTYLSYVSSRSKQPNLANLSKLSHLSRLSNNLSIVILSQQSAQHFFWSTFFHLIFVYYVSFVCYVSYLSYLSDLSCHFLIDLS